MKRSLIILVVIAFALLVSCASGTDIDAVNSDGSPIWTTVVPQSNKYIYGVGSAKLSNDNNSRNAADTNARADLTRKLEFIMQDAVATYSNDAEDSVLGAYEQITVQTVSLSVRGVNVEQRWTAPDGTVWTLVSLPMKDVDDTFELEANEYRNRVERERMELEAKYLALLATINANADAEDADLQEAEAVRSAAEAYYREHAAGNDAILGAIDPAAMRAVVRSTLMELGYEVD